MNEATIKRDILRRLGRGPVRVFNNPVGSAWQGIATRLPNGDVLLHNPRRVVYGLCPGSSDLIGWRTVEVTPEMVGRKLAVFVAVEAKTVRGRASEEQQAFLQAVRAAGGIGVVARSPEGAEAMVMGPAGAE